MQKIIERLGSGLFSSLSAALGASTRGPVPGPSRPMPPSRKHVAVEPLTVQVGDVGKALRTVTALVAETTACSAPTVLVEGVGDHAFGQQPRTKLRPFADLDELPSRGQPVSAAFDRDKNNTGTAQGSIVPYMYRVRIGGAKDRLYRCADGVCVLAALRWYHQSCRVVSESVQSPLRVPSSVSVRVP